MTKEQQDLAWQCMPKDTRRAIRIMIKSKDYASDQKWILYILFGLHNLTSDTEPEEMLMVSRSKVQEAYKAVVSDMRRSVLFELFGDKCLSDKEEPKPKFKVGDKVRVNNTRYNKYFGSFGVVKNIEEFIRGTYVYNLENDTSFIETSLEPYTEPETKDNMEEKELNLAELLKGCEGERFYLLSRGYTTLKEIIWNKDSCDYSIVLTGKGRIELYSSGKEVNNEAAVILYPSKELYEKYPLDAYSAWMEWAEVRKPKRWHPKNGEGFWCIYPMFKSHYNAESDPEFDWDSDLNHFKTEELCQQACEIVKDAIAKFHEKNSEE